MWAVAGHAAAGVTDFAGRVGARGTVRRAFHHVLRGSRDHLLDLVASAFGARRYVAAIRNQVFVFVIAFFAFEFVNRHFILLSLKFVDRHKFGMEDYIIGRVYWCRIFASPQISNFCQSPNFWFLKIETTSASGGRTQFRSLLPRSDCRRSRARGSRATVPRNPPAGRP